MADDIDLKKPPRPKKEKAQPPQQLTYDGVLRTPDVERRLNEQFAIAFRGAVGDNVLGYLRSISIYRAHEPGTDPNKIVQMEGARWLVGIIEQRIKDGEDKK